MRVCLVIFIVILVLLMLIQTTKELREEFSDYREIIYNMVEGEDKRDPLKKNILLLKGELPLTVNREIVYNTVDKSSSKYINLPDPIVNNNVEEFSYSFWFIKRKNGNIENKAILLRGNKETVNKAPYIRYTNNGITNKQKIIVEINTTDGLKTITLEDNAFSGEGMQLNDWNLYTFNFRPYKNDEGTKVVGSLFEFYINTSLKHVELFKDNVKFLLNKGSLYIFPQMGYDTREEDFIGSIGNVRYNNYAMNIVDIEREIIKGYDGLEYIDNNETDEMSREVDILLNDKNRGLMHLREVSL